MPLSLRHPETCRGCRRPLIETAKSSLPGLCSWCKGKLRARAKARHAASPEFLAGSAELARMLAGGGR